MKVPVHNLEPLVWFFCCCRYLIQNLTGSDLWYWADQAASSQGRATGQHRVYLPAYAMQELKVRTGFCITPAQHSRMTAG